MAISHAQPPEPVLEWVMLFSNGRPASAVLRTSDMEEVATWAQGWPNTVHLHRRIVLEGLWVPADQAVAVDLGRLERKRDLAQLTARSVPS